ncbi:MAG: hypothetical protein C3F07_14980 [Anaerolineales bacterium]|nr:hypothetical protein [Anaerolineae bacterium]PWB71202.1 MAG: hypothetical protein C3F07_14980 [Anaerolineales bacterium]
MKKFRGAIGVSLVVLIAALTYLPLINRLGYYFDDWYLMYSAGAYGPGVFWDIFSIDRPLRALVMVPAYILFGKDPLDYNLSAFLFRVLGALALLWILDMVWPEKRSTTTLMSLLFLIYPGFLSQPNAIDYQSHIISFAAALFSVALTLKAILSENRFTRIALHGLSILLGWFYLSQIEWYISIEIFRWACIFLLSSRSGRTIVQRIRQTVGWGYPSLVVPLVFLGWRLFFFTSERGATDVGIQLEQVKLYPLQTMFHWGVQVLQDLFDVTVAAWGYPLSQLTGYIRGWGIALALAAATVVLYAIHTMKGEDNPEASTRFDLTREALSLGLLFAVTGLLPIAMVNREVAFPYFSRYSWISSIGVVIFIVAIVNLPKARFLRDGLIAGLCVISILTHHGNTVKSVQETEFTDDFWWQVSWRVPQIEKGTTLLASYPGVSLQEDYFVWGPANLIYYPEKQKDDAIQPGIYAAVFDEDAVKKVLARERQKYDNRRNIITYPNFRNILILTRPSLNSCVRVIDGMRPEFSSLDGESIRVTEPYSEIEHVLADETIHTPPTIVFGPEPPHGWCYYYQKADLARQRGEWDEVINIGGQAFGQGFEPGDLIEWMPFLQAYAAHGEAGRLNELAPVIARDPYIASQACQILGAMPDLSADTLAAVNSLYCQE